MTKVKNTAEDFDDCIGKVDQDAMPISLFDDETNIPQNEEQAWSQFDYDKNWKGMPSYQSDDLEAKKKLIVNFSSEEDFNDFCEKLGYTSVSMTTKTTFYPEQKKTNLSILRWVDEEEATGDTE